MIKIATTLCILIVSFTAHARFIQNLGDLGVFPQEDKKLEILQGILLDSSDKAFIGLGPITLDTSLAQKKKLRQIDARSIEVLLQEASSLIRSEGCNMNVSSNMAQEVFAKIKYDGRGSISTVSDLLPILNDSITCLQ